MRRARWLAGFALLVAAGSCVAPSAPPVVQQVPRPAAPRPTQPPALPRFALDGAIRQGGTILGTAPAGAVRVTLDGLPVPLTRDRRFLIAFDRDAPPRAILVATTGDGRSVTEPLVVAPGGWRIEQIDAPFTAGKSGADFARLRPAELAEINAARRVDHDENGWQQRFVWPVTGRRSGLFGAQRIYRGTPGSFHSGADVAVPAGTPVRAPADGIVVLASDRPFMLEGNLVIIDHGMGLNSAFLHLSRIDVHAGEHIRQGEQIGLVGATGRATGPHMHWGMKWHAARIDPALLAGPMPGE